MAEQNLKASIEETSVPSLVSTRQRLIEAAIDLWGAHGTQGVSLREITRHAGVMNNGALRYYFGQHRKPLDEALLYIRQLLLPRFEESRAELESLQHPSVRQIIQCSLGALVDFYFSGPIGERSVRLLSRLIVEEGEYGQRLLIKHFGEVIWVLEALLKPLIPHKSPTKLRVFLLLAIDHALSALPHRDFIRILSDPENPDQPMRISDMEHLEAFVDYLTAALEAK